MAASAGSLIVSLGLDAAEYTAGLDRAEYNAKKMSKAVDKGLSAVGGALAAVAAAAGLAALAIGKMGSDVLAAADNASKMSQKYGVSAETLQEFGFAADLADVSIEALGTGLKKLSVGMFETQAKTGEARYAFKALGIDVESTAGVLKPTEQLFLELADKFADMEDGAGKTALAVRIFGRAGADLIPLLNSGSKGIKENADEARRFGIVVSNDAAKAAEQFRDDITRLQASFKGLVTEITIGALPKLQEFITQMLEGIRIAGSFGEALRLFGLSTITSSNAAEKIREINDEIKELEQSKKNLSQLPGYEAATKGIDNDIAALKKKVEFAKLLQRQAATRSPVDDSRELARTARGGGKGKAPVLPGDDAKKKKDNQDAYLKGVEFEEQAARDIAKYTEDMNKRLKERAYYENIYGEDVTGTTEELKKRLDNDLKAVDTLREIDETNMRVNAGFTETGEAIEGLKKPATDFGFIFNSALEDAILNFKDLRTVGISVIQDIARALIREQVTKPLATWASSAFSGVLSGLFGGTASEPLHTAIGGRRNAGQPLLVGERGPELWVPDSPGTMMTNGATQAALGGGGGVTVNIVNQSGTPLKGNASAPRMDGGRMVVDLLLTQLGRDGASRDSLRGMLGAPA